MQDAERDLRCYVTARQLHLSAVLRQVFQRNALTYPLFYSCLDRRARQLVVLVLLCLARRLGQGRQNDDNTDDLSSPTAAALAMSREGDVYFISRHILSFLSFPALATVHPPHSLLVAEYAQLRQQQSLARAASAELRLTEARATSAAASAEGTPQLTAIRPSTGAGPASTADTAVAGIESAVGTPRRAGREEPIAQDATPQRPTTEASPQETPAATRPTPPPPPPPRTSAGSAVPTAQFGHVMEDELQIRKPLFFCRGPLHTTLSGETDDEAAGVHRPIRSTSHTLYVRMIHHSTLYEETLTRTLVATARPGASSCAASS